jgi:putative DNA primase/helicase
MSKKVSPLPHVVAEAQIEYSISRGEPFLMYDGALHKYSADSGYWLPQPDDHLAHELYRSLNIELNESAKYYRTCVKEFRLRCMRMSRDDERQQFGVHGGTACRGENARADEWILLKNGIFKTDRFVAGQKKHFSRHSRRLFSQRMRPFAYDAAADCPTFRAKLDEWLDADSQQLLQEVFGICNVFDKRYEKFVFIVGPKRSGKSTAKNVLEGMLGKRNVSNVGLERFGNNFGLDEMVDKLVNVAADVGTITRVAEGAIKAIVSRDAVSLDRKFKSAINVVPAARLIFLANDNLHFKDRRDAILDRMLVIAFDRTVSEEFRDHLLADKLMAEMPGIFNWAMQGLRRLRQNGRFTQPARMSEILKEFRETANPARHFCEEMLVADPKHVESTTRVYEAYAAWMKECGYASQYILDAARFGKELVHAFPSRKRKKLRAGDQVTKAYQGFRLLSEAPLPYNVDPELLESQNDA